MDGHVLLLGQWLALAALVAATLEYELLIRRRAAGRVFADEVRAARESGLRGLVRVFAADREDRGRR